MPEKKTIHLTSKQRDNLRKIIRGGKHSARVILRARILLKSDAGWTDQRIAEALETTTDTVRRMRLRARQASPEVALEDKPRSGAPTKLTLEEEARLVALACSSPPAGRRRWTVRLLTDRAVKQSLIKRVAPETVRGVLQKTKLSRGKFKVGAKPKLRRIFWPV